MDYTEVDGCANPNEHLDVSDGCHHSKFPKETLEQLYGPKVKQCCSSHGYTYIQNEKCEVRFYIFYSCFIFLWMPNSYILFWPKIFAFGINLSMYINMTIF